MITFQHLSEKCEIGSNSYKIEFGDITAIIDAGIHPKKEGLNSLPHFDLVSPNSTQCVFVSHSHLDHTGGLPVLMKKQKKAKVFLTPATAELTKAILHNSVNVMQNKRNELGLNEYPFYSHKEIDRCQLNWETRNYQKEFFPLSNQELKSTFYDAGHILGSAGILFKYKGKSVFYTGDVQFKDQTLISGASFPKKNVDILIMETTRGNSENQVSSRNEEVKAFIQSIKATLENNGCVLVPVFAMGKTQEVLTMIYQAQEKGDLPEIPIFIGGLSTKMTKIYDSFAKNSPRILTEFQILKKMNLNVAQKNGKHLLKPKAKQLFILSSGMLIENTPSFELMKKILPRKENSLLFVGYADPDTPAGKIKAKHSEKEIDLGLETGPISNKAKIQEFDFSGHSSRKDLLNYAIELKPKDIILVHGDEESLKWFKEQLEDKLPETRIIIPEGHKKYQL